MVFIIHLYTMDDRLVTHAFQLSAPEGIAEVVKMRKLGKEFIDSLVSGNKDGDVLRWKSESSGICRNPLGQGAELGELQGLSTNCRYSK